MAALIAEAAGLAKVDENEPGWSLAVLSDHRGHAAVLLKADQCSARHRSAAMVKVVRDLAHRWGHTSGALKLSLDK